ncbi:uncharacterized protein [Palaemon carinicauda]|uniref:uncharacterized protein n=1 Tax=Palaemon carinicauda TaxID=392227 RepID=UPI0035B60A60
MYLILLTVLCGLATVPNRANGARIPPYETVHEAAHLTDVGPSTASEDQFLYLIASDEGGAERLTQGDFSVTPEGHFVDINKNGNSIESSEEAHEISLGSPDIPEEVLHSVLDEIAHAVEGDPLLRETIKTSLKSGEIPVEVLIPGHQSNDENAILIEVFHLEDEEEKEEKSVEDSGSIEDDVAATEEPITVTTMFPTENNFADNLQKLFSQVEKDVEQTEETVEETRKRRNSEQTDKVETLLDNKETERTHEVADTDKVSSTSSIIIPSTANNLSRFERNTESWIPMQVFDFVTRKYAESNEEGLLTTLSPQNYEASPTNDNLHSINIDLPDSEEGADDEDYPDRRERRQIEVSGESNEDYVATTEVIDSSEDSSLHLPGVDKKRTQQQNGNNEQRKGYVTEFFSLKEDDQLVKKDFQTREDSSANKENPHNITPRIKRQLDDSSNLPTVNEEAHTVTISPLMLDSSTVENSEESITSIEENDSSNEQTVFSGVHSISSSEVSLSTTRGGSTIPIEEETTTSSLDEEDTFTTTLPSESETTTMTEGN